jgi:phage-related protein (TIGR01555 family)
MAELPKSKSVQRAAKTALAQDAKVRSDEKAGKRSTVDSFVNFAHNLGIGTDNPMTSSSYGFNPVTRNRTLLEWVHRGSWLGGVAVDVVADDMTRAGIDIKGDMDPKDIEALEEAGVELGVWNKINETIKWSRLYGGALAVILIDGQDPATPLRTNTIRKGQFRGLLPLDRWMVEPSLNDLVTDLGPDLGLPKFYRVTSNAPALSGVNIHYSRCIRLVGIQLPYWQRLMENLWGLSVIERLYDRMIAFDSASTGAAQLVYKSYMKTYKVKDLREVVAAGGDALVGLTAYVDQMRRFQGIEGITLIDAEDDVTSESHSAFGGLSDALAQFGQQLSGALQIPLVRLFGQSPQGFSTGETDLRNYYDTIKQAQEKDLRVGVTKIYRIIAASEGIAIPEGTKIEFRSLWQLTDEQKANIAQTVGNVVSAAEEAGLIDRGTALKELKQSSHTTGIFSNISAEQITEAESEGPPIPEDVEVAEIKAGTGAAKAGEGASEGGGVKDALRAVLTRDRSASAAGILFVTPAGDMLLLKRGENCDHSGTWGLPGGRIELGEDEEFAARRELREETGFIYRGQLKELGRLNGFVTYFAEVPEPFKVTLNNEHTAFVWTNDPARSTLHPGLAALLST